MSLQSEENKPRTLISTEPVTIYAEVKDTKKEPIIDIEHENQQELLGEEIEIVDSPEATVQEITVRHVIERTALSIEVTEVAEEATTILVALPEQVQTHLKEYIQSAEPEAVEAIETQIAIIAKVADRLHALVATGEGDSEEALQIEQWLTEQYTELLHTLGDEYDEDKITAFIELVKSKNYDIEQTLLSVSEPYDPMHERYGWSKLPSKSTASNISEFLRTELARLAVLYGLAA